MIHVGCCLDILPTLPAQSVHTCVTSPPYFGLRDYGHAGQIGLEPTPAEFVDALVRVFREVRRVLREDGTVWLNLGDSYAANRTYQVRNTIGADGHVYTPGQKVPDGMKPKDLIGIPWMVAFALRADGWYLRQDIIWSKPNPMPESVRDRCTKAHEYLFLLSKSERYYFDAEAIQEQRSSQGGHAGVAGWAAGDVPHNAVAHNRDKGNAKTFRGGQYTNGAKFDNSHATTRDSTGNEPAAKETRNRRSVWTIATQPFKEAHFATFPEALIEPCILAGAPAGGVVLDPFMGAGTTAVVAQRLGRRYVGCELNPDYAAMASARIGNVQPGLSLGAAA